LPEIVQEIGAYAGMASVVGLAVLSALYFSQARDVKRLREWAGRAPERSEQGAPALPGKVVAQPQQTATPVPTPPAAAPPPVPGKPGTPAKPSPGRPAPATPAGQAAPAAAAATGAGPATAQQSKPTGAPVPVGQNANAGAAAASVPANSGESKPGEGKPGEGAQESAAPTAPGGAPATAVGGAPATAAGASSSGSGPSASASPAAPSPPAPAEPAKPATSPPAPTQSDPPTAPTPPRRQASTPAASRGAPSVPASTGRFASRPGVTSRHSPSETAILPPRPTQGGRIGGRYLAIVLAGLVVLGGAAAYGVTQLTGDDDGGGSSQGAADTAQDGSGQPKQKKGGAVKPGNVTVAVLNGTTVPGLAATLSDEVGAAGFKVGTITNFTDQQLAESVVQYANGHQAEARAVSRRLGIAQREPVNPSSQALAGDAGVIVIAGADKAP
jgi:hypothetical protein